MPDHFVLQMTCNLLRALVPKQNFPAAIDHVHTDREAVQDGAVNLGIANLRHGEA